VALGAAAALAIAACSGGGSTATPAATPTPATTPTEAPATEAPPEAGVELAVSSNSLGDIVVDGEGRTLYLFEQDTQGDGTSACSGGCADNWPALVVAAGTTPGAGDGVTGEIGTITRGDGSTQVTLNGWPLYYFAGDSAAGDTNGQGLNDVWWVVTGAGEAIKS
jgi:predicted lipoprotein with Yx(FWY)xxD motif